MAFKIYCAGPLFNRKEQEEMTEIASSLENAGFNVFLPQRDGLELAKLSKAFPKTKIKQREMEVILSKAIFSLDVFQVLDSDGLVLNLNGRVPDEGAMVEAGIAWANNKKIVLFKSDSRTMINGADNPLVIGLSNFICVSKYSDVPKMFHHAFSVEDNTERNIQKPLSEVVFKGKVIYDNITQKNEPKLFIDLLLRLFGNERVPSKTRGEYLHPSLSNFIQE